MLANPLVTVYIVNHNYGKYLQQSIKSVLNQSYKKIELIIIDNGSTDNSKNILKKLKLNSTSIIFQKNKGLISANNKAIKMAKGSFVMRLDADDWLKKNAIFEMVKVFKKDNKIGLVFPNYYEVDESGNVVRMIKRHNFKKVTLLDQPAHGACTMFKKELVEKIGFYDEEFNCQDGFYIWLEFIKRYKVKNISKSLFYYRKHSNNLTKNEREILKTRNKIIIKSKKKKKFDNTIAVIPVRGKIYDYNDISNFKIKNKELIDYTIQFLKKCKFIKKIYVSSSDENFLKSIKKRYSYINIHLRNKKLNQRNTDVFEVIKDLKKNLIRNKVKFDSIFKLSISGLFRSIDELEAMKNYAEIFKVDQVLGVRIENENYYKHNGSSLVPLNKISSLKLERDDIFKEINHTYFITKGALSKKKLVIGHIVLDQMSSFNIKSDLDLKIAEKIINLKI